AHAPPRHPGARPARTGVAGDARSSVNGGEGLGQCGSSSSVYSGTCAVPADRGHTASLPGVVGNVGVSCGTYGFTHRAAPRGPAPGVGPQCPRPGASDAGPPRPRPDLVLARRACASAHPPGAEPRPL